MPEDDRQPKKILIQRIVAPGDEIINLGRAGEAPLASSLTKRSRVKVGPFRIPKGIVDWFAARRGKENIYYFPTSENPATGRYDVLGTGRIIDARRVANGQDGEVDSGSD